ncbi:hypothetical protein GSI_10060 [Ganoderma sinense ZZ0214-1]|uniref:Uncharacterized protein n=1 Tax=Ganoderma sinense ZZ0214-1 TaxID=1077348 RepID=A0A2G8RZI6_9APHY|nr:hypothetical protein GSI_10060 [Ganoderma sinense ZZ0214-1]
MSNTPESTTTNAPKGGSTSAGAGAAKSIYQVSVEQGAPPLTHPPDAGDSIRENAMDFLDAMFGTPRHPQSQPQQGADEPRPGVGATRAEAGEEVGAAFSKATRKVGEDAGVTRGPAAGTITGRATGGGGADA